MESVYENQINSTTDRVWNQLQTRPRGQYTTVSFYLTKKEIELLNKRNSVTINLGKSGWISPSQENARIEEIRARNISAHTEDGQENASLTLIFEHTGDSLIESNGRWYAFTHHRADRDSPLSWSTDYNVVTKGPAIQEPFTKTETILLRYLLNGNSPTGAPTDDQDLYSYPGAWADITIRKEAKPVGVKITIDSVRVTATFQYQRRSNLYRSVDLDANMGAPLIEVDTADVDGKMDGRGSFRRTYGKGTPIQLTAQDPYGSLHFKSWQQQGGVAPLSSSPRLPITMDDDRQIEAIYGP